MKSIPKRMYSSTTRIVEIEKDVKVTILRDSVLWKYSDDEIKEMYKKSIK